MMLDPEASRRHYAIVEVLRRMPTDAYAALVEKSHMFNWFIPEEARGAMVMPFRCTLPPSKLSVAKALVLYLPPSMERRGIDVVIGSVAHELAHIFLDHELYTGAEKYAVQEEETWATIRRWGFVKEEVAHKRYYQRYHSRQRALKRRLIAQWKRSIHEAPVNGS